MSYRLRCGYLRIIQQSSDARDRGLLIGRRRGLPKQRAALSVFRVEGTSSLAD
jgi:hypothetical protein